LHKSKFHDGIRYRYLSRNHSQYWRQIPYTEEVESWYRVPIYTIEQADKLGLDPSENWRISPDGEPKHLNANSYYWPDDYVVTVLGPGIQPWVMPVLFRNIHEKFPYVRVPNGSFAVNGRVELHAYDMDVQYSASHRLPYSSGPGITSRMRLLIFYIAKFIANGQGLGQDVILQAYKKAYKGTPTRHKLNNILASDKIMTEVAMTVKEILKEAQADPVEIMKQLMDMASKDNKEVPDRRLQVALMIARMNGIPVDVGLPQPTVEEVGQLPMQSKLTAIQAGDE